MSGCDFSGCSFNRKNLVLQNAGRDLDGDGIADPGTEQCLADRRFIGNAVLQDVSLLGADDLIFQILVLLHVVDFDLGAEADLVRADFIGIHDLDILEELLEFGDAGLNVALLVLRGIVLSVLGEVALRAGLLELRRDILAAGLLQAAKNSRPCADCTVL